MKIALVHYAAPPVIGGVERVLAGQAKVLSAHGYEVTVVCGNEGAKMECADVVVVNDWEKSARKILAGFDVVIVHNMFTMPFHDQAAQVLAQLGNRVRLVNWVHDVDVSLEWFKALDLRATHVAVSKARKILLQERLGVEKVLIVPNGVDVASTMGWSDKVKKLRLLDRDLVLFHPTRILARKNVELGVAVIDELRRCGVDAVAVVSGAVDPHRATSSEYATALRDLIRAKQLDSEFVFLSDEGEVDEKEMRTMYQLADVLWFPSKAEGFGLPLVEAALFGAPVMCSDIPPHREVAEGMQRVEFFDLEESVTNIAEKLLTLVQREGGASRERRRTARRYDWERIYEDYLEPLLKEG